MTTKETCIRLSNNSYVCSTMPISNEENKRTETNENTKETNKNTKETNENTKETNENTEIKQSINTNTNNVMKQGGYKCRIENNKPGCLLNNKSFVNLQEATEKCKDLKEEYNCSFITKFNNQYFLRRNDDIFVNLAQYEHIKI